MPNWASRYQNTVKYLTHNYYYYCYHHYYLYYYYYEEEEEEVEEEEIRLYRYAFGTLISTWKADQMLILVTKKKKKSFNWQKRKNL